jgi:hypothetical protein
MGKAAKSVKKTIKKSDNTEDEQISSHTSIEGRTAGLKAERDIIMDKMDAIKNEEVMNTNYDNVYEAIASLQNSADSHITNTITAMSPENIKEVKKKLEQNRRCVQTIFMSIGGNVNETIRMLHKRREMDKLAIEVLTKELSMAYYRNYAEGSKQVLHSKFVNEVQNRYDEDEIRRRVDEGVNKELKKKEEEEEKKKWNWW